jgi:hypothetical protein
MVASQQQEQRGSGNGGGGNIGGGLGNIKAAVPATGK